jgi:RimJ/RimL family protein N-acetyltransferase/ketosteroid isomerase-like protein
MAGQPEATQQLAGRVAAVLEAADLAAFRDLLDPAVRWGAPGDPAPPCQNRDQVLSWWRRARDSGARAHVAEALASGDRILVGLKVTGTAAAADDGEHDRWQVLTVRDGRVADIVGFDDRAEAAAWAGIPPDLGAGSEAPSSAAQRSRTGLGPGAGPRTQPGAGAGTDHGRWSPPRLPLADELVELRLPEPSDAAELHAYAARPGGMEGTWVPLAEGTSLAECEWLVGDWLAGWRTGHSFHGPTLVITRAGQRQPVGQVGLAHRRGQTVELIYGVAPEYRRRGYATRATMLVARWLLDDGLADEVELRIDSDNVASQRVAAAAGFAPAGTIVSHVPRTGESYEDLRFVLRRS